TVLALARVPFRGRTNSLADSDDTMPLRGRGIGSAAYAALETSGADPSPPHKHHCSSRRSSRLRFRDAASGENGGKDRSRILKLPPIVSEWNKIKSMPAPITANPSTTEKNGASSGPQVNVFAVHGVDPEVQAYAMAKYSRSALSMKESLKEISEQKAEQ